MTVVNPFIWGLGRRKSAIARVRVKPGSGAFTVNDRPIDQYFSTGEARDRAKEPLRTAAVGESYDIFATVNGGGPSGQADAVRLGLARALKDANPVLFDVLRKAKLLTRDARSKERKKPGRKAARRGFQFSKR
ncbi:MAG: 30S ribosomal protein S9 [Planctomycetes bacterium]|nr:30S ribosomal protein S9 [Planctomycetota bacterium]